MQTQAGAVLPAVSSLLSHLQPVKCGGEEDKTSREPDRRAGHRLDDLYREIRQQDSEQLFSQDNDTNWGVEVAAEIRCNLSLRPVSGAHRHATSCLSFAWSSLLGSLIMRLIGHHFVSRWRIHSCHLVLQFWCM